MTELIKVSNHGQSRLPQSKTKSLIENNQIMELTIQRSLTKNCQNPFVVRQKRVLTDGCEGHLFPPGSQSQIARARLSAVAGT